MLQSSNRRSSKPPSDISSIEFQHKIEEKYGQYYQKTSSTSLKQSSLDLTNESTFKEFHDQINSNILTVVPSSRNLTFNNNRCNNEIVDNVIKTDLEPSESDLPNDSNRKKSRPFKKSSKKFGTYVHQISSSINSHLNRDTTLAKQSDLDLVSNNVGSIVYDDDFENDTSEEAFSCYSGSASTVDSPPSELRAS